MTQTRLLRWDDLFLFAGRLSTVAPHRHSAAALLLAGDAPFRIRTATQGWRIAFGAFVPAGLVHELDCGHRSMVVMYFDPLLHGRIAEGHALRLGEEHSEWVRAGRSLIQPLLSDSEGPDYRQAFGAALEHHILPCAGLQQREPSADARLLELRAQLQQTSDWNQPLGRASAHTGLSRYHFSRLFSEQVHLGWTAYRNWMRMLNTCSALEHSRASLTQIALEGGYSSSAHFSAAFRITFGITPSEIRPRPALLNTGHRTANI